jgi:competence protein ComEC
MMTLILFGWVLKRPGDLLNSLAAAALIILVWDPRQLFEAGFQLSFLVVLIIGLMLPPLNERVDEWVQLNPLVPLEHTPEWKQWGVKWLRHFLRYLALSLTAWLGSIPLAAAYFHLFSPVSVLANVVAVPLGAGALMSMMGSLVCGGWLPGVAVWFNHSAWFFMVAMTRVSEWSCALPGAYWYVTAPSWPVIGLYYAGLVAWLTGWLRPPKSKLARGLVLAGLAGLLGFGWWTWASARTEVRLTVLPLSGGATVFVEGGHNRWLINCGSEDAVELTLKPFLRAQGVNRLPPLIITTGEEDCCGGAATLLRLFAPDELFTSPSRFRSAAYRELTDRFDQAPLHHHSLSPGATAGCWEALYPGPDDHFARADDRALVLLGRFYQSRILLLSGLGRDGQSALLNQAPDLRADVVVAGLPAQGEPLCDALLAAVRPRVIVIADAAYPVTRRAGDALKARLARTGMRVIYTRTAGAVTIVAKPGGLEI